MSVEVHIDVAEQPRFVAPIDSTKTVLRVTLLPISPVRNLLPRANRIRT